jgi:hypothetical protein
MFGPRTEGLSSRTKLLFRGSITHSHTLMEHNVDQGPLVKKIELALFQNIQEHRVLLWVDHPTENS